MVFILPAATGQGMAATPPAVVEGAKPSVATGRPAFGGWRVVAQMGTNSGAGSVATPGTYSSPGDNNGSNGTNGNGSNGTNGPSGSNGTNGTNSGNPDYGPSGTAGTSTMPGGSTTPPLPSSTGLPGSSSPAPSTQSMPGSTPSAPASTSVPSYGGGTTQ